MNRFSRRRFLNTGMLSALGVAGGAGLNIWLPSAETTNSEKLKSPLLAEKEKKIKIPRRQVRGTAPINAQFPNFGERLTLKADLHLHSVFSDGDLWPEARVEEAVREGLDVLCISDHIEVQPHQKEFISSDLSRGYELAAPRAEKENLVLIPGLEITRMEPYAKHLNALFLKNFSALKKDKFRDAVYAAAEQECFIFWNHPAWGQKEPKATWYPQMDQFLDAGVLNGFEVVNGFEGNASDCQLDVLEWALQYKVAPLGNSDAHKAIPYLFDWSSGGHRPMTLIFAKERTLAGVREALFGGNTAIYYYDYDRGERIIGSREQLYPFFQSGLKCEFKFFKQKGMLEGLLWSSFPFELKMKQILSGQIQEENVIYVPPGESTCEFKSVVLENNLYFEVENFVIGKGKNLIAEYEIILS